MAALINPRRVGLLSSDVPVMPTEQAVYVGQRSQSIIASREHVEISPKYGGEYGPGQTIRIEIPSQAWLDPDLFTISFRAKIFAGSANTVLDMALDRQAPAPWGASYLKETGATAPPAVGSNNVPITTTLDEPSNFQQSKFCRFGNSIQSIINRLKILQGSTIIEDIQDYNSLYKILSLATVPEDHLATTAAVMEGTVDINDPSQKKLLKQNHCWGRGNARADDGTHYYNIRLLSGLLRCGKFIPLKFMGQLTIEIYLENSSECLVSSVGGQSYNEVTGVFTRAWNSRQGDPLPTRQGVDYPNAFYRVDEVRAHCHFVTPMDAFDTALSAVLEESGFDLHFDTYSTHNRQINATGRSTHSFQERAVSVRGGYAVMRNANDIGDIRTDTHFAGNNVEEWQWKVGSAYVPAQPVRTKFGGGRGLAELLQSLGTVGDMLASGRIKQRTFLPTIPTNANELNPLGFDGAVGMTPQDVAVAAGAVGLTFDDQDELNYECSLPCHFIIPLPLRRTNGDQISGFNTAATNTDIELQLILGNHSELADHNPYPCPDSPAQGVGQVGRPGSALWKDAQTQKGSGANTTSVAHTFQPSKFRFIESYGPIGTYETLSNVNHSDTSFYNGEAGAQWGSNRCPRLIPQAGTFCVSVTTQTQADRLSAVAQSLSRIDAMDTAAVATIVNNVGGVGFLTSANKPGATLISGDAYQSGEFDEIMGRGLRSLFHLVTKPPHAYSRLTFYANIDSVVRLHGIGQLTVFR